jgi:hypothetical protein
MIILDSWNLKVKNNLSNCKFVMVSVVRGKIDFLGAMAANI